MKRKMEKSGKSTKRVVFSILSVVMVFCVVGFLTLNASNGKTLLPKDGLKLDRVNTSTGGGIQDDPTYVEVRQTFTITQSELESVDDLHFTVWQKEDDRDIVGWRVNCSHFLLSTSVRCPQPSEPSDTPADNGLHAVNVDLWGEEIPRDTEIEIEITLWLTEYNTMRIANFYWTIHGEVAYPVPSQGWDINYPLGSATSSTQMMSAAPLNSAAMATASHAISSFNDIKTGKFQSYTHMLTISNDDKNQTLKFSGLKCLVSYDKAKDLKGIDFSKGISFDPFILAPGKSKQIPLYTDKDYIGAHIYMQYDISDATFDKIPLYDQQTVDHPITSGFPSSN